MKQEKQTELLRTQQMLNEVNRKLLMTLGVAEVFPMEVGIGRAYGMV